MKENNCENNHRVKRRNTGVGDTLTLKYTSACWNAFIAHISSSMLSLPNSSAGRDNTSCGMDFQSLQIDAISILRNKIKNLPFCLNLYDSLHVQKCWLLACCMYVGCHRSRNFWQASLGIWSTFRCRRFIRLTFGDIGMSPKPNQNQYKCTSLSPGQMKTENTWGMFLLS